MPLRRPPDPTPATPEPSPAPRPYDPLEEASDPTRASQPARPAAELPQATAPAATAPETEAPPSPSQLRSAARELAQAAERTERSAREILGRAHTLCESLARSLDTSERRTARETLGILLIGMVLLAATAVLATIVTVHEIWPRSSVLELLRILVHAG